MIFLNLFIDDDDFALMATETNRYYSQIRLRNRENVKPNTGTRIPDPLFPHLVPPVIMVWIFVWKYIFEPFIHILQHFVLQLSRSTNNLFLGPAAVLLIYT